MALSSPNGKLEDRVNATEVKALNDGSRALDGNCTIGMHGDDFKRASLGRKLTLDVGVGDIDKLANLVLVRDARFVFAVVVLELAAVAALVDESPVGNVGGGDDHVSAKSNLCRCCTEGGMVGGAEGEGCAL